MHILFIMLQDSAQRLHISAQRIIISSCPIFMHILQHIMHISAHIMHIFAHIAEPRIMQPIVIWHMAAQSWSMQAISGVMPSILPHFIIISMHIDMHIPQSSIHRVIELMSIFIMSIGVSLFISGFQPVGWTEFLPSLKSCRTWRKMTRDKLAPEAKHHASTESRICLPANHYLVCSIIVTPSLSEAINEH
jgi:hypothetical protein